MESYTFTRRYFLMWQISTIAMKDCSVARISAWSTSGTKYQSLGSFQCWPEKVAINLNYLKAPQHEQKRWKWDKRLITDKSESDFVIGPFDPFHLKLDQFDKKRPRLIFFFACWVDFDFNTFLMGMHFLKLQGKIDNPPFSKHVFDLLVQLIKLCWYISLMSLIYKFSSHH